MSTITIANFKMEIPISEELINIFNQIINENLTKAEWSLIESDDMFKSQFFEGGFDSTEQEFTFSYFGEKEYWFQLSLEEIEKIIKGNKHLIIGKIATY